MKQEVINNTQYLCNAILNGVIQEDKDSVRSHLEDLNLYLQEAGLLGE